MRSNERKKTLGEVFTPPELVKEMLDQLPEEVWQDPTKTFLDNSCGNGNFLVSVLERLLAQDPDPLNALSRVHGVDIMQDNVDECRERLQALMPNPDNPEVIKWLNRNIVCADGLRYHYRFDNSLPYSTNKLIDDDGKPIKKQKIIKDKPANISESNLIKGDGTPIKKQKIIKDKPATILNNSMFGIKND